MAYTSSLDVFRLMPLEELIAPPRRTVSITPSDANDLGTYVRALTATTAGNVSIVPIGQTDETATVVYVAAGQWLPVQVRKVNSTGTTATGIVGAAE